MTSVGRKLFVVVCCQSHIHKVEYVCKYEVYKCIILDTTLKDPRLHALVTSIRGALRRGFTNGQMKTVTYDIVNVVQTTGLCPKHSLSLNVLAALIFLFSNHACFVNFVATQAQSMVGSTLSCLFYPRQKCTLIPITIEYLAGQLKVFSLVLVRNVKSFGRTEHLILSEFPIPMNAHGLCNKRDRSASKWSEIRNNSDSFSFRSSTVSFTASNHHLNVGRDPSFYVCDQCHAYSHFHRQTKTMEVRGDDVSENGSQLLDDITNKRWGGLGFC